MLEAGLRRPLRSRRRRRRWFLVLLACRHRVGVTDDVADDHGDVVVTSVAERAPEELVGRVGRDRVASRSTVAISSSLHSLVRPSLQMRRRVPGRGLMTQESTSTPGSMPIARVRMCRCGWTAACSTVSSPWRTSCSTRLWSSVSWTSFITLEHVRARVPDVREHERSEADARSDDRRRGERRAHAAEFSATRSDLRRC